MVVLSEQRETYIHQMKIVQIQPEMYFTYTIREQRRGYNRRFETLSTFIGNLRVLTSLSLLNAKNSPEKPRRIKSFPKSSRVGSRIGEGHGGMHPLFIFRKIRLKV